MNFAVSAPNKIRPMAGIEFDREKFDRMLYLRGWKLTWEKASRCPCVESAESDHARPDCTVCSGLGWEWHSAETVRAVVTGAAQVHEEFQKFGAWGRGQVRITLPPEQLPGYQDRFTALDSVFLMQDYGTRTADGTDALRLPIVQRTMLLAAGTVTVGVTHVRIQAEDGTAGETATEGIDFAISDGEIDWSLGDALGTAPPVGRKFTATYYAHPRFIAIEDSYSARDSYLWTKTKLENPPLHLQLPVTVSARLVYEGDDEREGVS